MNNLLEVQDIRTFIGQAIGSIASGLARD